MAGGGGGNPVTTTKQEIPGWLQQPIQENIQLAGQLGSRRNGRVTLDDSRLRLGLLIGDSLAVRFAKRGNLRLECVALGRDSGEVARRLLDESEVAHRRESNTGEGLIDLDDVEISNRELTVAAQRVLDRAGRLQQPADLGAEHELVTRLA